MGDQSGLPRINEITAYLNRYAPETAAALKERSGDVADLMTCGIWGGDDDDLSLDQVRAGLAARAEVLDLALTELIAHSESDTLLVKRRLLLLRRVRFASAALGAVGSSGVVVSTLAKPMATIVIGVLTLCATLATLLADTLILGQRGNEAALRDASATLMRASGEGALIRQLLKVLGKTDFQVDEMRQLLADANRLFSELIQARSTLAAAN